MRLGRMFALVVVVLLAGRFVSAQEWVPDGVRTLRQEASSKTEFSLDHSMLVLASKLDPDDQDLRRVVAGVSGLAVHSYRFQGRWTYDPEALGEVKQEYHAAGWKQILNNHDKHGQPGATDLWIRIEHKAISNIAILVATPSEVNLIEVSGSISPLDLLHLCGHFGIPKIEGGVEVPNNEGRRP